MNTALIAESAFPPKSRRAARELALQVLYALEFQSQEDPLRMYHDVVYEFAREDADSPFARELVLKTFQHRQELDRLIETRSANWDLERMAIIDRIVLRMALCEFLYFPDIPPKVSIDEAIEIAKRFSTEKSGKFVNGILDSLLADLRTSGRIVKSGRGLIDRSLEELRDEASDASPGLAVRRSEDEDEGSDRDRGTEG
ncbi:MAG: transcription antitermination factor NusB [candidate division KSB1 bacterium]|nr:transcription antitermination factor NusB [candidate division KSB1 bacterium]